MDLVVERLGWEPTVARKTSKKGLCESLFPEEYVVHDEKVCTDRRKRIYPNRYTKEELVRRIRERNPFMNRAKLLRSPYRILCRLARIPFVLSARPRVENDEEQQQRTRRDPSRYYEKTGEQQTEARDCLERGRKKAFQYQRRVIEHFRRHRGLIAVHSLGSGKTLTAVYASQCYLDEFPDHKVVVVSPASLIENFKKEMREFGDLRHADRYEFFSFQGFFNKYKHRPRACRRQFLIVDEAHNLRTEYKKSLTTGKEVGKYNKVITDCAEKADRILLLTATPLVNKPSDIAPLLNLIRDDPTAENRILKKHIRPGGNLREIGLCRFSFYERERANADYPEAHIHDIFLPMPPRFYAMYRDVEHETMEQGIMRIFGQDSKLKPFFNGIRRAVNILSELPEEELLKSPKVRWILQQIRAEPHKKTVIFSNFLDMGLQSIMDRLPDTIRSAYITGSQPKAVRKHIVDDLYNKDQIDILFISRAGGEGLDLKGTRRMILLESGWNENSEKQVIGRGVRYQSHAHLPPEERVVDIYRLYHIKPDEQDQIEFLLSPEYNVEYNDPTTWLSADLMLRKIASTKYQRTDAFLQELKQLSIERNEC